MRAEHIKRWMVEARNTEREEAESEQKSAEEGTTEVPNGTRGWRREGGRCLQRCSTGRGW